MKETAKNTKVEAVKGSVEYADQVIEKMIGYAIKTVPGLLSVSGGFLTDFKNKLVNSDDVKEGINVEVGKKQVATDLKIVVEYGKDIPAIVDQMKEVISKEVETMTHLQVVEVNIEVVDVKTREEFEADSVTLQDRLTEAGQATGQAIAEQANKAGEFVSEKTEEVKEQVQASRVE